MYEFKLPDLGEGIHEGEILDWHVQVGDTVAEDQTLVEVETDKAAVTIPSPVAGKVIALGGEIGDIIDVGKVLVVIESNVVPSQRDDKADAAVARSVPIADGIVMTTAAAAGPLNGSRRPIPAAPATRGLARKLGVDLHLVTPTGPAGRVTADDVRSFIQLGADTPTTASVVESTPPPARRGETHKAGPWSVIPFFDLDPLPDFSEWGPIEQQPFRSVRRKVARKMVTSMTLVPHVANMDDADVTLLDRLRKEENARRQGLEGPHLTLLAFVVKAVTAGLKAAPVFNSSLDPIAESHIFKKYFNIGIAADTGRGLVVPVIKDADRKNILEISAEITELAIKAREGTLAADDMRGGTFTITNIGPLGSKALIPAINYPEVAILGMGKADETPVVRDGEIVIRKMLPITLAFDHRVADGADAARFMNGVVRRLGDPNQLLLEC